MPLRPGASTLLIASVLVGASCSESPDSRTPVQPRLGSVSSVSVTSASPAWGDQGATSEQVTINGSGFARGAQPAWALNGVVSADVQVVSTQYVSSKQLVATINIASGATLAYYDVVVTNTTGTKGIGNDLFEVTQAFPISGLAYARGTNDYGMAVGNAPSGNKPNSGGPALWIPNAPLARTGTIVSLAATMAYAQADGIDQVAKVIVGQVWNGVPLYWLKTGSSWSTAQVMPHDPGTTTGFMFLASDPASGNAAWVGGEEVYAAGEQPRTWSYDAAARLFARHVLPIPAGATGGRARGVNPGGEAVGYVNLSNGDRSAAYWNAGGSVLLLPPGGNSSDAWGITPDGTMAVGTSGGFAVFWTLTNGAWTGPYLLPGNGATAANGIDSYGRIIGGGCPKSGSSCAFAWVSPYTSAITLAGLGDKQNGAQVYTISPSGKSIVGTAAGGAAGWQIF